MKPTFLILIFGGGLALSAIGLTGLKKREGGLQYHRNPFAIQESGYGKTLARLSQNTIDVVWHLGIEQVNPIGHDHDHDHADHDHEHDHGHHEATGDALMAASPEQAGGHHSHPGEENATDGAADHGWLEEAKEWMHDLSAARYDRTSPFAVTGAHKQVIAADIEQMLLRAYKMDPTDFGVYSAYYLFLTIHEYGGTAATREHARLISRVTIGQAMKEEVDPQPWLTAATATMNLFFLEQEDFRAKGEKPPVAMLEEFRKQMAYVLHRFAVLREQAKADNRWEMISEERRESMHERERFATMAAEQFDVMLARARKGGEATPATAPAPGAAVAESASEEAVAAGDR